MKSFKFLSAENMRTGVCEITKLELLLIHLRHFTPDYFLSKLNKLFCSLMNFLKSLDVPEVYVKEIILSLLSSPWANAGPKYYNVTRWDSHKASS